MLDWSQFPNFSEDEFKCRCGCGRADMNADFMHKLQKLRTRLGFPLTVSSGFRCPEYNERIGGGPEHPTGKAADLVLFGDRARELIARAIDFPRIGISQKGPVEKRFVHVGTSTADDGVPSPWIWSY